VFFFFFSLSPFLEDAYPEEGPLGHLQLPLPRWCLGCPQGLLLPQAPQLGGQELVRHEGDAIFEVSWLRS